MQKMRFVWKLIAVKRSRLAMLTMCLLVGMGIRTWFINQKKLTSFDTVPLSYTSHNRASYGFGSGNTDKSVPTQLKRGRCSIPKCNETTEIGYKIFSGYQLNQKPVVCIDGQLIQFSEDKETKGRGLHIIKIHEKTRSIYNDIRFDTYLNDYPLLKYLKTVPANFIVVFVCFDECSAKLSPQSRRLLAKFGSSAIHSLEYRENFLMIGQLGLEKGQAIEKIGKKSNLKDKNAFGNMVELSGCLKHPMGKFIPNFKLEADSIREGSLEITKRIAKHDLICDFAKSINKDYNRIPLHFYIGNSNSDTVKICLNDTCYIDTNLNGAGRGLNMIYWDNKLREITKVAHFDTFVEDSSSLEILLESMQPHDIIIVATFDEASARLTPHVRKLFFELGSSMIQNLKYRGSWYFVGKKGIIGFSPIEDLAFPETRGSWAPVINITHCITLETFDGLPIKPDVSLADNVVRHEYCHKYGGDLGDFCAEDQIYEYVQSAPLIKPGLAYHPIYNVPIIVLAGHSQTALRMTLETLVMQPGIKLSSVILISDGSIAFNHLAMLFGIKTIPLIHTEIDHDDFNTRAMQFAWTLYPNNNFLIFIEPNVVLSPDYMHYMSQAFNILSNSTQLSLASAWNPFGFQNISGNMATTVFRIDQGSFPSYACLYKRSLTDQPETKLLKNGLYHQLPAIYPETSRVYVMNLAQLNDFHNAQPFKIPNNRITNLDPFAWINTEFLSNSNMYDHHVKLLIETSKMMLITSPDFDSHELSEFCAEIINQKHNFSNMVYMVKTEIKARDKTNAMRTFVKNLMKCYDFNIDSFNFPLPTYKDLFRYTTPTGQHRFVLSTESQLYNNTS